MKNQELMLLVIGILVILITMIMWGNRHESFEKDKDQKDLCSYGFMAGCFSHCMKNGGNIDECEWKCSVTDPCEFLTEHGPVNPCTRKCYPSI